MADDAEPEVMIAHEEDLQEWKQKDVRARGYILSTIQVS